MLAKQLDDVPRELVRRVDLGSARRDALAGDRAHEIADLELIVRELLPGHARSLGRERPCHCGFWHTASMLLPSASWTKAP